MERVRYESLIVQDLLNFYNDKSLNISPWYQRRSVWSTPQKAYLINTIFENKPVPSIYIRHQIDIENEKSIKEVVDGQQRVRTIISYKSDEFPSLHPDHRRKVFYTELTRDQKGAFLATALSVGYLIGADDMDVIEIFGRINSISKTLNPQEKRNAQFSGDFKQFSLSQAAKRLPFWRATGIFSANDIARMQEVQFISDLVINLLEGLTDFSASKIDRYYKDYDHDFPQLQDLENRIDKIFSILAQIPPNIFADSVFRQYQLSFSLMIALDSQRSCKITLKNIHDVIEEIDRQVTAYKEAQLLTDEQTRFQEGFTGGNLHRIRTRRIRHETLVSLIKP